MPVVGRGRIVVWEGASLWLLENAQEAAELRPHAHHAIQITFQLSGGYEVGVSGECYRGPVTAIWSDTMHTFCASGGAAAFLFIAPESSLGRALRKTLFADRRCVDVSDKQLEASLGELQKCYQRGYAQEALLELGRKIVGALPTVDASGLPDPRVLAMIAYAKSNLENTITLPSAAMHICLSESRARHLFVSQTGLPFKTYVLWLRLERAVSLYADGRPLTAAAHDAGFADSAHFSRTFKRTFGLPAATLQILQR